MKTKLFYLYVITVIISSCSAPGFLPKSENIDVNPFGSYIKVQTNNGFNVNGELISIDSNSMIIRTLPEFNNYVFKGKCAIVLLKDVNSFTLRYAQPEHYGWSIPLYSIATLGHGILLIISLPLNLIVTVSVTVGGESAFQYNNEEILLKNLKNFSRFPQGLPPTIEISKIY